MSLPKHSAVRSHIKLKEIDRLKGKIAVTAVTAVTTHALRNKSASRLLRHQITNLAVPYCP